MTIARELTAEQEEAIATLAKRLGMTPEDYASALLTHVLAEAVQEYDAQVNTVDLTDAFRAADAATKDQIKTLLGLKEGDK